MPSFRVGLAGGFSKPDGSPTYPEFDWSSLATEPGVEILRLTPGPIVAARETADLDTIIINAERSDRSSIHPGNRLAVVARFGVGFDKVDVSSCTENHIAVALTPDGVRRPVAVSVITFLLALAGRVFEKDKLARQGPTGFAMRGDYADTGLVG